MKDLHPQQESLAEKVLGRIEEEQIRPSSRARFVAKDVLFWMLWVLCVLLGAATVSASLFVFKHAGWKFYMATHANQITFFVDALPYFWMLALLLFTVFAYENVRHTKHGYRFSFPLILAVSLPVSLLLGSLFYGIGVGDFVENDLGGRVPFHEPVSVRQERLWVNAEEGRLAGRVDTINFASQQFELSTFDGTTWQVSSAGLLAPDMRTLERFSTVRVIGIFSQDTNLFHACFVLPWNGEEQERSLGRFICDHDCERMIALERSTECRGLRPYEKLERLHIMN